MVESGDFVLPGKEVGFSEEFIPGEGTYEDEGKIFASITGDVNFDLDERKITVRPKTSVPPILKEGVKVIGTVVDVKSQVAVIEVMKIKGIERKLPGKIIGGIHISRLRNSYVSEISRELGFGDIVLAKVVNTNRIPLHLSIVDGDLGVIKSHCEKCNGPLVVSGDKITCKECNKPAYKKLSSEYGKGLI